MSSNREKKYETEYLIVGGGPTGLGAACSLDEYGQDWLLLEKEEHCGGLARSFRDEHGFTWDLGGHVLFSHYDTYDRFMEQALGESGWLHHQRESWIWLQNRFVPYPFQRNLHRLDAKDRWACVKGLLDTWKTMRGQADVTYSSFREWILGTFGKGIAELFMLPYNYKVWAWPPDQMDYSWIGERVAVPALDDVLRSVCTEEDDVSWGPNNMFRFPVAGGTGAVWQALAMQLPDERIHRNQSVIEIDAAQRRVRTREGREYHYRRLISTMPLDELVPMANRQVVAELPFLFSATHVVGVGMDGYPPEHLRTKCWMYFPEMTSPYYRVTVFSNYSPNNVAHPGAQWSLMAEVSESSQKPVDPSVLAEDVIAAFIRDGLLSGGDHICSIAYRCLPKAYPTPFLNRDAVVEPLLRGLEEKQIFSRGRFGAWKYEVANMDHSFMQGWECAVRLVKEGGEDMEPTLNNPRYVNSRRNS